ncbi:MAG: hypothetical protein KGJ02_08480 [Verrucomicrobiota bacterium]|nr:hypothetical protein [Verrucomicrobiota bacterium]
MNTTLAIQSSLPPSPPLVSSGAMRKGLLVAALACGILAMVPPLRMAGVLAARSISVLTRMVNFGQKYPHESAMGRLLSIAKVAFVALGLAAIAASLPLLLVGSLGGDAVVRVVEMVRAIREGNQMRTLIQSCVLVIDVLALSAILLGSWQLMVIAACACVITMLIISAIAYKKGYSFEAICYLGLAALGIASAVRMEESIQSSINAGTAIPPSANTTYSGVYTSGTTLAILYSPPLDKTVAQEEKGNTPPLRIPAFAQLHSAHGEIIQCKAVLRAASLDKEAN